MERLARPTKELSINTKVAAFDWRFGRSGVETPDEIASLEAAIYNVQLWLTEIIEDQEPRWLLICGVSGNGKSHLARRATSYLARHGESIYEKHRKTIPGHQSNPEVLYSYRQEGSIFQRWTEDLIDPAKDGDFSRLKLAKRDWFKIIDDLGAEQKEGRQSEMRPTAFAIGQMASVLEGRIRKWSLFTSNLTRSDFAKVYDPRIADRFSRYPNRIIEIEARSFALRCEEAAKPKRSLR